MKKRIKPPIRPSSKPDPTGVDKLERGAIKEFSNRLKQISKNYISLLSQIPSQPVINKKYQFELDQNLLERIMQSGELMIDDVLYGGALDNWFYQRYVKTAYERGTAQEYANLSQQSTAYAAYTQNLSNVVLSASYQARLILVRARIFEQMKNLSATIKSDMARILTDGLGRGLNPLEIARNLTNQTGINRSRANRIARTEITTALRKARLDESDRAQEELNLNTAQIHISALSPTTRATHAERHGKVYTEDEQREFWESDANSINCKCSTVTVLVDGEGKPINNSLVTKLREEYAQMKEEYSNWGN